MTIDYNQSLYNRIMIGGDGGALGANEAIALNSNFVLGSSGNCAGAIFFAPPGNVHLHSVYFFLSQANASSHDLTCSLIPNTSTTAIRTVTSAGGTTGYKWIKFDFSSYSDELTYGNVYRLIIGDTAGSGSSYQIRTRTSSIISIDTTVWSRHASFGLSSNGFSSVSYLEKCFCSIIVFSDGSSFGVPYTQAVVSNNTVLERGLKFIFDEKITCSGISAAFLSTSLSTLQILESATPPGGAIWSGFNGGTAYTMTTSQKQAGCVAFSSIVTFEKNTYYRLTVRSTGANNNPGYNEVQDAASLEADALKTMLGAGSWCYTIDNGAGGWTDYNNATDGYRLARMSLILKQQEVITSSAGGVYTFGG